MQPNPDRLNSIRERLHRENDKKSLLPSAYKIETAEAEILKAIILHDPDGVSHGELAKIIKKDRKNLRIYTKRLIGRKIIRRESGPHGRYHVTNPYGRTLYSAYLFGNLIKGILPDDCNIVQDDNKEPTGVNYTSYFRPKYTNDSELQRVLFEFSNMVGAFVLYILIQGLNPANNRIIVSREYIQQDQLVQEWVKTTLSEVVVPDLLRSFKESILPSLRSVFLNPTDPFTDVIKFLVKRPLFQVSEQVIEELEKAYARLYPVMFGALEEMRSELPIEVVKFEERLEHAHHRRKQQSVCKHEYKQLIFRDKRIKHCHKCHHTVFTHMRH